VLRRVGDHLEVVSNGVFLMDTRDGRSERLLVRTALDAHPRPGRLLVGGLGVGFSLVEAVSQSGLSAIDVVEI
jgi:spermidine synthase